MAYVVLPVNRIVAFLFLFLGALSNTEFIQMFRRGWSAKRESGHGYGLYNVRQIVERHGGKIITGNEERKGGRF